MADALEPLKGLLHRVKGVIARQKSGESRGLRTVRDPEGAEIDIVAVHGLGGEGFKSWVTWDPGAGKPKSWLEELLAKDIPRARIMTYGYMSDGVSYRYLVRNVLYGRALDLVKELGVVRRRDATNKRPLFFIAHSLGGWIVKRALIISNEATDSLLRDIELSTCGVAFFGTLSPGRPSSPSPLANVIRRTTSNFGQDVVNGRSRPRPAQKQQQQQQQQRQPPLMPEASDVEWLENQMEAFKAIAANLPRLAFHETKTSPDGFVVEKRHSMAGSDGAQVGLKATHSDLVKFQGRDANYKTFIAMFRDMIDKARSTDLVQEKHKIFEFTAVHHLDFLKKGYSVPYKVTCEPDYVVPRPELLHELDAILGQPSHLEQFHIGIATIWGEYGSGKTTLAKHWVDVHHSDVSFVFWVGAESWETVVASYLEFANTLINHYSGEAPREQVANDLGLTGVGDMLKAKSVLQLDVARVKSVVLAVKDWLLRPDNDKWLLVFDNVESSYNVFDFIPLTLSGKIILTSRDSNCCEWGTKLHVDALTPAQGVELLCRSIYGEESEPSREESWAAERVASHCNYHAQNIALAASTIRKKGLTIAEYESSLETKLPLRMVGSTIDLSPVTRTVLRISAMLSSSVIPVAIFSPGPPLHQKHQMFKDKVDVFQDVGHLGDVLQHLLDQNFIQTPSSIESSPTSSTSSTPSSPGSGVLDYFILDPAARSHVRSTLTSDERLQHAWLACNVCVDGIKQKEVDASHLGEIHNFGRLMAPHAKTCYDDWSGVLKSSETEDTIAWHVLGQVCMTQGAIEQAIGCFELSLEQNVGMDAMTRIQTSLSLATLLQQVGQHAKSREVLAKIDIPSIDQALGFRVAMAKASAAAADGELHRAEDQYETLEQKQEEALGPTDTTTVSTVQKLAATLERLGKMEEAQALYRRVYISYQNTYGQNHAITLDALDDLANISRASNAIDEAEALYKQAVEIKTRTLGPDHPGTAHAIQKLAVVDDLRCRYEDARAKYEQALGIMAKTLGTAHPLYMTTAENMALSSRLHGQSLCEDDRSTIFGDGRSSRRRKGRIGTGSFSISSSSRSNSSSGGNPIEPPAAAASAAASAASSSAVATREASRARAFDDAERLYLHVLTTRQAAAAAGGAPCPPEELLETASKLREMYENEAYFAARREERVAALMALLRDGKRRGTNRLGD